MTNKELHEKAMKEVRKLSRSNHYEATEMMRMACCEHLRLINIPEVDERGWEAYYNLGDVLFSLGENFGEKKNEKESYESWNERTKKELQDLYKCKLTGEYCIARNTYFHFSDLTEGNHNEVMVNVDLQMRCPAFEYRKNLVERLEKEE